MSNLQPGDGLNKISAGRLNRALDMAGEEAGVGAKNKFKPLPYTKAIGRNKCGYAIKPGAPVLIGEMHPDQSTTQFAGRVPGYYDLYPPYLADTVANYNTQVTNKCDVLRVGIALEAAEDDKLLEFAIDGTVQANWDSSATGIFASLMSNASGTTYRDKIKSSPISGFGLIIATFPANSSAIIRIGDTALRGLLGQTQSGGLATGAEGVCDLLLPTATGWAVSGITYPAWTTIMGIPGTTPVLSIPIDNRFFTVKLCG